MLLFFALNYNYNNIYVCIVWLIIHFPIKFKSNYTYPIDIIPIKLIIEAYQFYDYKLVNAY